MSKHEQKMDRLYPVLIKTGEGWKVEVTRDTKPIGPRLWKRTSAYPDYPTDGSLEECLDALERWDKWLLEEYELAHKRRKRK
jgi:hypothetical protein